MARYFVGNGTNWSSTSSWATTDGGTPGAAVPLSSDDVYLTALSPGNLTIDATANCKSFDCTGFTHTLTQTGQTLNVYGTVFTLASSASGMTYTAGTINLAAASGTILVTTAGQTLAGFNPSNGGGTATTSLQDALTATGWVNHNGGAGSSLVTNSNALATGGLSMVFGTLTLGSSVVTVSGLWFDVSNGTLTSNTATLHITGSIRLKMKAGQSLGTVTIDGANSTSAAISVYGPLTVNGTLTVNAYSSTVPLLIQTSDVNGAVTPGTAQTISAATFVATNRIDFQDITASGAATWTPASGGILGDCLGNTGITFTVAAGTANGLGGVYRYAVAAGNWSSTGTWSTTSGGSTGASVPLPQDTAVFNGNSGAGTYTGDLYRWCRDLVCTGFAGRLNNSDSSIYGNVTLGFGMDASSLSSYVRLCGRGSQTLTSAGHTFGSNVYVNCPGGTYTLQDAFGGYRLYQNSGLGTFNDGGQSVTLASYYSNTVSGYANALVMSGIWSVGTQNNTNPGWWVTNTSMTLTAMGSTLTLPYTGTSAKTFYGGDKTYGTLSITGGGTGAVTIDGNNTFDTLTIGAPKSVIFTKSQTTTVTNFNATGSAGNVITITSDTAGTFATLSKASGNVVCDYLSLKDSHAGGGATWYAGSHSTLVSGTTGWLLADPPVNATVVAPPATTMASALVPGLDNARAPPAAAATATAPVPTIGITISAVSPSATANAPVPALQIDADVTAVTAGATSAAPLPALSIDAIISTPGASALGGAPIPRLTMTRAPIVIDAELQIIQLYAAYLADAQAYTVDLALE